MTLPTITPDSPIVILAILGVIHFIGASQLMNAIRRTGYSIRKESGLSLIGAVLASGFLGVIGAVILFLPLLFGSLLLPPLFFALEIGIMIVSLLFFAILFPIAQRAVDWGTLGSLILGCLFFFIGLGLLGTALRNGTIFENLLTNLALMAMGAFVIYISIRRLAGLEEE